MKYSLFFVLGDRFTSCSGLTISKSSRNGMNFRCHCFAERPRSMPPEKQESKKMYTVPGIWFISARKSLPGMTSMFLPFQKHKPSCIPSGSLLEGNCVPCPENCIRVISFPAGLARSLNMVAARIIFFAPKMPVYFSVEYPAFFARASISAASMWQSGNSYPLPL